MCFCVNDVCVHMREGTAYCGACVEVRGQLSGISILLLVIGVRMEVVMPVQPRPFPTDHLSSAINSFSYVKRNLKRKIIVFVFLSLPIQFYEIL